MLTRRARSVLFAALTVPIVFAYPVYHFRFSILARLKPRYSVEERVAQYGPAALKRLEASFGGRAAFPPKDVTLLIDKAAKRVEVFAPASGDMFLARRWQHVAGYDAVAMSGGSGPKLREGDDQVPEGFYAVAFLNPNSAFHLSLRLDYPNADDHAAAVADHRTDDLGTDIMIHGPGGSRGCIALGASAIEDLFVLAATVGKENVRVMIVPEEKAILTDTNALAAAKPAWVLNRYLMLNYELKELRGVR